MGDLNFYSKYIRNEDIVSHKEESKDLQITVTVSILVSYKMSIQSYLHGVLRITVLKDHGFLDFLRTRS